MSMDEGHFDITLKTLWELGQSYEESKKFE